jgi:hypothetical protein
MPGLKVDEYIEYYLAPGFRPISHLYQEFMTEIIGLNLLLQNVLCDHF